MAAHAVMTRYGACRRTTARYSKLRNLMVRLLAFLLIARYYVWHGEN